MKNLSVDIDPDVHLWLRMQAAGHNVSLSGFVASGLKTHEETFVDQMVGLAALLNLPAGPLSEDGRLPPRSDLYDD